MGFAGRPIWSRTARLIHALRESSEVRFVIAVVVIALLALAGLYVYGLTLKPETRTIEQDAIGSTNA